MKYLSIIITCICSVAYMGVETMCQEMKEGIVADAGEEYEASERKATPTLPGELFDVGSYGVGD